MKRIAAHAFLLLRRGVESLVGKAGTRDAAQLAFYVLMSAPAALLVVVSALSTVLDDPSVKDEVVNAIVDALPLNEETGESEVEGLLDGIADGAGAIGFISIFALLYSASGAVSALRAAVNKAWGVDDRPLVPAKGLDIAITLAVLPLAFCGLGLYVLQDVSDAFGDQPLLEGLVATLVSGVAPAILIFAVLCGIYRVLPARRRSLRAAWPGAIVGLVGLGLVSLGARIYFELVGGTSAIYGAIGALLAVSFCIYLGSIAVILGGHVAAAASRLDGAEGMDEALAEEAGADGPSIGEQIKNRLKSLVVREEDDEP